MGILDNITGLATIGIIAVIGFFGLKLVGGFKGITDLFGGVTGAIEAVPEFVGETAAVTVAEVQQPGATAEQIRQAILDQIAEQGGVVTPTQEQALTDLQTGETLQAIGQIPVPLLPFVPPLLAGEAFLQTIFGRPTAEPSPVDVEPSPAALADIFSQAQALQRQIDAEREAAAQRARESQTPSRTVTVAPITEFEQNIAQVEQIRQREGDEAADRAAMFLRL